MFTNTGWAGDKLPRKSMSSFVLFFSEGCLMCDGARAQSVLVQSSDVSETCGVAAGESPGLLAHAMLEWLELSPTPLPVYLGTPKQRRPSPPG